MSGKKYLTGEIGEQYRDWKSTDIILVTEPTGSGRSYFVLHTLLKHAIGRGQKNYIW